MDWLTTTISDSTGALSGITGVTWHVCSWPCWCGNGSFIRWYDPWWQAHEHDYRQVKNERLLFCRTCGETKRITAPKET